MTRAEIRDLKIKETKAFRDLLKVQHHFFKTFNADLNKIKDPRHQSYIDYQMNQILYVPILKNICNIQTMREMTREFNVAGAVENLGIITDDDLLEEIPHYVTVNEVLKKLEHTELEMFRTKMIKQLIRKRSFDNARFMDKYWLVIVDATQMFHFKERHCKHCLIQTHVNKDTGEETTRYYHNVLEAKIVLGENLVVSIGTEFIENPDQPMTKQDCETKAFKRLSAKLKKAFPRLPICIMGDSLYASSPVFNLCKDNRWEYLIRFKDGSIPSVASEFHVLKDREEDNQKDTIKWVNEIHYKNQKVNVMEFILKDKKKETRFQWITSLKISRKRARDFVTAGRKRWMIENQGFNIQKNFRYDIQHANSLDYNAMKNHYMLIQIADIILQLYEKGFLILKALKKTIKNISSDLLLSFSQQLTKEDILYTKKRTSLSVP